jgi:hypothetical protein
MTAAQRRRVVIIGGGFGGLFAAKVLRHAPVDVTLVDRTNHHLLQPFLYQLATGILSEGAVAPPLRQVLRKHKYVEVQLANLTALDLERRIVAAQRPLEQPIEFEYDSLIVATGATGSYFVHDEYGVVAPGLKTVDDALELRSPIFGAFEMAESERGPDEQRARLTPAVVGGGPTGVEMAGQITELVHRSRKNNFRRIDPKPVRVLLFDAGPAVLATVGNKLSEKAEAEANRRRGPQRGPCHGHHLSGRHGRSGGRSGDDRVPCEGAGRRGHRVSTCEDARRGEPAPHSRPTPTSSPRRRGSDPARNDMTKILTGHDQPTVAEREEHQRV